MYQEGIFRSKWLSKFVNCLDTTGKTFKTEKIVYYAFFFFKKYFDIYSFFFFLETLEILRPFIGLKLIKLNNSKSNIQVCPITLSITKQYKKAIYWLIKAIQLRKEVCLVSRIYIEIKSVVFKELTACVQKKKEYYNYAIMFKSMKKFKW